MFVAGAPEMVSAIEFLAGLAGATCHADPFLPATGRRRVGSMIAEWARQLGIRLAHGHLFAPPMPAEEFAHWLTRPQAGAAAVGAPTMASLTPSPELHA